MEKLIPVVSDKKRFLPLLLLADPDEGMVDRYLAQGEMFVLEVDGKVVSEAVVLPLSDRLCELKNLAVEEALHRQGYGSRMLRRLFHHYRGRFSRMQVGTSDPRFYEKAGFVYSHTVSGFFTEHYPEPIYDNGVQCVDMIYLVKELDGPRP